MDGPLMPDGHEHRGAGMKKILIAHDIHALMEQHQTFLHRSDFSVFVAATTDEALKIHRAERVDLIIAQLDMPGMPSEEFCSLIREDEGLRAVSLIMVCADMPAAIERSGHCRANAVLLQPVHPVVLMVKAQQLLEIAARETLRVLLGASVDTRLGEESFICRSRNVSATGMLIETDRPLAEGDRLSCLFYLPNAKKIEASGKIVRAPERAPGNEDVEYGLMFTEITPEARQLLIDYVKAAASKPRPGGA
jgi:DNA-binding response OmpR family regulator